MKKILFADLDDTLFQSHRKANPEPDWQVLAYLADGSPISYATPRQQASLELFMREMTVIPVTARNFDALMRVHIPFTAEAVINYGGIILNTGGTPDQAWLQTSQEKAQASEPGLHSWVEALATENARQHLDLNIRLIRDFDIPFYVVAKSKSGNIASVQAAARYCAHRLQDDPMAEDIFIHTNNNNLALIPRWLDKRHAVEHLHQRYAALHNPILTFGMGDSLVDLGFMGSCDYIITPGASQIATHKLGVAP